MDTNIFLNVIYKENELYKKSKGFLKEVQNGKHQAFTSSVTLLEIILDMTQSGYSELTDKAVAFIEDMHNLEITSLDKAMVKQASCHVLKNNLTIHDAYHLATALCQRAEAFVTRDEEFQEKIAKYIKVVKPEEV
ncbi:MAG: type II toxin-antitoxin system VapC family toxin [Candidatus Bathyarchaeia archaeon]